MTVRTGRRFPPGRPGCRGRRRQQGRLGEIPDRQILGDAAAGDPRAPSRCRTGQAETFCRCVSLICGPTAAHPDPTDPPTGVASHGGLRSRCLRHNGCGNRIRLAMMQAWPDIAAGDHRRHRQGTSPRTGVAEHDVRGLPPSSIMVFHRRRRAPGSLRSPSTQKVIMSTAGRHRQRGADLVGVGHHHVEHPGRGCRSPRRRCG